MTSDPLTDAVRPVAADRLAARVGAPLAARGRALAAAVRPFPMGEALVAAAHALPALTAGTLADRELDQLLDAEAAQLARAAHRLPRPAPPRGGTAARYPAEGLRRMLIAMVGDARVVVLRLAEALVELRALRSAGDQGAASAARVVRDVYAPLANRLGLGLIKWELEDLAFSVLEPDAYRELAAALAERRADREADVAEVAAELARRLAAAGIVAEVAGRPKHIYSIHRKMQRKGVPLSGVFDVRAVRVLVEGVERCYAALGVVHGAWPPVPGEFDDYIARPKGNQYRSLHTAVVGPGERPLEVQIRTREMHEHAELGVAAHWRYKAAGGTTRGDGRAALDARLDWLRGVLDGGGDDRDFVARFRAELFDDRIYVLTPQGEVIDLPSGATPLDFAYHVHTALGHRCRGAKVGGRMVPLTHRLGNGEQVEVLTGKQAEPSRDWLNPDLGYLASNRAREKVRAWFRAQDHEADARAGREIVERELARLGARDLPLERLVAAFGAGTLDGLLAKVGAGDVTAAQLAGAVQRELGLARPGPTLPPLRAPSAVPRAALTVGGVSDLLYQLARCCRPLPPEPVQGFITRSRGVTVHRSGCAHLARAAAGAPERAIEVAWGDTGGSRFRVGIEVRASDRSGLLREVTSALADAGVEVTAVDSQAHDGAAHLGLVVQVAGLDELKRALLQLQRLPGVASARRAAA
jgi:GTP pyrophosphokinase